MSKVEIQKGATVSFAQLQERKRAEEKKRAEELAEKERLEENRAKRLLKKQRKPRQVLHFEGEDKSADDEENDENDEQTGSVEEEQIREEVKEKVKEETIKIDPKLMKQNAIVKSFINRTEQLPEFFELTEKRLKNIKKALEFVGPIYDGVEVSLFDVENDKDLIVKRTRALKAEKLLSRTKTDADELLKSLFKICVETTHVVNKIEQLESINREYQSRLTAANEKLDAMKIEKAQDKFDNTMSWADLCDEESEIVLDEEEISKLKKEIKFKIPLYDDHWELVDNKTILSNLDTDFCSTLVEQSSLEDKKDVKEPEPIVEQKKTKLSFAEIAAKDKALVQTNAIPHAPIYPSVGRHLARLPINYNPSKNCCITHNIPNLEYELLVPGYVFQTFDEISHARGELLSSVGKFIRCHQNPSFIGFVFPPIDDSDLPILFFMNNAYGALMGYKKVKYCPFEHKDTHKCKGYEICDFFHNKEGEYFSYSPSMAGCPCLGDGENLKDVEMHNRASDELMKWAAQRKREIKLMYCELEKFNLESSDRLKTANAMMMWEMIARYNTGNAKFATVRRKVGIMPNI